jgi:hypothetical protein
MQGILEDYPNFMIMQLSDVEFNILPFRVFIPAPVGHSRVSDSIGWNGRRGLGR